MTLYRVIKRTQQGETRWFGENEWTLDSRRATRFHDTFVEVYLPTPAVVGEHWVRHSYSPVETRLTLQETFDVLRLRFERVRVAVRNPAPPRVLTMVEAVGSVRRAFAAVDAAKGEAIREQGDRHDYRVGILEVPWERAVVAHVAGLGNTLRFNVVAHAAGAPYGAARPDAPLCDVVLDPRQIKAAMAKMLEAL